MANKWHVKVNGDMGMCSAAPGQCPFRSEGAVHFSNAEDAVARSEEIYESQLGLFPVSSAGNSPLDEDGDIPDEEEFYEELLSYESVEDRVSRGEYLIFQDRLYRVSELYPKSSGETIVEVVDMQTGEPEELHIDRYNSDELRLRGDGPLDPRDPDSYTMAWDESAYLGSYISSGDQFLYDGRIYRAESWEWNRALLQTDIEAYDSFSGQTETITIRQGNEPEVQFLKGTKRS